MKACVTPQRFQELYNRFQNQYTNEGPVIVTYYPENLICHIHMMFHDVCWTTRIERENANKFLSLFQSPIELSEQLN